MKSISIYRVYFLFFLLLPFCNLLSGKELPEKPIQSDFLYNDEYIKVEKKWDETSKTYYFLSRITHKDKTGNILKLKLATSVVDSGEIVPVFAKRTGNPIIATNASTVLSNNPPWPKINSGNIIINGQIIQERSTKNYTLGIKHNNELVAYPSGTTAQYMINDGVVNALTAFTPLIQNSISVSDAVINLVANQSVPNPRQVIAQFDNMDILFLSCGGRGFDGEGMTAKDVIRILQGLNENIRFAYNLDGGGSTTTVIYGDLITKKIDKNGTENRTRADFLYIEPNIYPKDIFVKTTGLSTNDGASWNSPTTLEKALSLAVDHDVIHIAAGTYTPSALIASSTEGLTNKDKTFEISKNITLIGGYPADASAGSEPDPAIYKTVLSGDLSGGVKVYHTMVITAPPITDRKVIIKGITVKDGYSDYADSGSVLTVNNSASMPQNKGAGVYVVNSIVEFVECDIVENNSRMGSAITTLLTPKITLYRCNVERNSTSGNGAGIYVEGPTKGTDYATMSLHECTIANNTGAATASGLYTINLCKIYVYNSTINNNTSINSGAGIYVREGTQGFIVNSTIHGNAAGEDATTGTYRAGLLIYGTTTRSTSFDVINTTVTANKALTVGGVDVVQYASSNIINTVISGNVTASDFRYNENSTSFTLKNSIVSDKVYNHSGLILNDVIFDKNSIGNLLDNGGYVKTCLINGVNNPARNGYGMSVTELTTLANTYIPAIPVEIITKDQAGKSRDGLTAIGALIDPDLFSNVELINKVSFKVKSNPGILSVIPVSISHLTIYAVSGVKLFDKQILNQIDVKLPSGMYIVKVNDEVLRTLVR